MEECAYRLEVVTEFLKAGIPIAKTDMLRSLLEKNGHRLTGSSNLGQYVSMALKQEIEQIKQELEARTSWLDKGHFCNFRRQHKTRGGNCDNSSIHGQ